MKTSFKNKKLKKGVAIIINAIFAMSFIFVLYALYTTDPTVSPTQVTNELDADNARIPEHVIVKSKVQEIKSVPLYGYAYRVSKHMYITNFSRLNVKVGSTVKFRVTGAVKVGDSYLVNADYE